MKGKVVTLQRFFDEVTCQCVIDFEDCEPDLHLGYSMMHVCLSSNEVLLP